MSTRLRSPFFKEVSVPSGDDDVAALIGYVGLIENGTEISDHVNSVGSGDLNRSGCLTKIEATR